MKCRLQGQSKAESGTDLIILGVGCDLRLMAISSPFSCLVWLVGISSTGSPFEF